MKNHILTYSVQDAAFFLNNLRKRSPKAALNAAKYFLRTRATEYKRTKFYAQHGFAPLSFTFALTNWCNLECIDCYPDASKKESENLESELINRAIVEGKKIWGIYLHTLTGGEPILHAINVAKQNKDIIFFVYTNATLITEQNAREISSLANIFPLISIEGDKTTTDSIRGGGIYKKAVESMDILTSNRVVWGFSYKLTKNTAHMLNNSDFFNGLISKGALFGRFLTYIPMGRNADLELIPTNEQRTQQAKLVKSLSKSGCISWDYINSPNHVSGCAAAGLRYIYIDQDANILPCVFSSKKSKYNLKKTYAGEYKQECILALEDIIINDDILKKTREIIKRKNNSCILLNNQDQ